ncbi:N-acetylgalactosamine 4-sulfate 6-O-sulfotransferase [Mytilus galloprovincialis]|uniref:N-acetylgalactosamine 4-sulfate 6-O-sulfotransferase n=1 Tax=Mytilus galloprovincialis TaxID=29158 RepID=A0A8B6FPP5_MYTGA|nr:N-acetylgalactosamine 4-sulfate 6-O-sulfotransferase [Mytilus galloprovincialis]
MVILTRMTANNWSMVCHSYFTFTTILGIVFLAALFQIIYTAIHSRFFATSFYEAESFNSAQWSKANNSLIQTDNLCPQGYSTSTEDLLCMILPQFEKQYKNPCWHSSTGKLMCLPYFIQIGVTKCGTSDMFDSLKRHPDVAHLPAVKEINFFNIRHYYKNSHDGPYQTFQQYVNKFRRAAKYIQEQRHSITGEFSVRYIEMNWWKLLPQNRGRPTPIAIIADTIKRILPNVKLLISLRDPVERSQSFYYYTKRKWKKEDVEPFETFLYPTISKIRECIKEKSEFGCIMENELKEGLRWRVSVTFLLEALYVYYIKRWMSVFQRDQFLVIPFEEYRDNKFETMNRIFSFLEIRQMNRTEMVKRNILKKRIINKGPSSIYIPLREKARDMLYDFYEPYNKMLYDYLNDTFTYRWRKEPYESYKLKYT